MNVVYAPHLVIPWHEPDCDAGIMYVFLNVIREGR